MITDAMVEAAGAALVIHGKLAHPHEGSERTCAECGYAYGWIAMSAPSEEDKRYLHHRVRAALEAAAPLIAAKAWEEGYQACRTRPRVDGYLINRANPYQTRADAIEHDAMCPHRRCPGGSLCCCTEASPRGKGGRVVTAGEWIAQRRTALGLLSAYEGLREMAGDLAAAVAVGSLGVRGSDITAAEEDARTSLPRALDALEAVLELHAPMPGPASVGTCCQRCSAEEFEPYPCGEIRAIEAVLGCES